MERFFLLIYFSDLGKKMIATPFPFVMLFQL